MKADLRVHPPKFGCTLYLWLQEKSLTTFCGARTTAANRCSGPGVEPRAYHKGRLCFDIQALPCIHNSLLLNLTISSLDSNPKHGILEVTGTEGSYVMDHGTFEIIRRDGGKTFSERGNNPRSQGEKFYQNIAAHLTKGERLVISGEYARRPIQIVDLAGRSARLGRALKAKYG